MSTTAGNGNITYGDGTVQSSAGTWSQAANGYRKLPDGTIIQWGTLTQTSGSQVTVSFPVAFPTQCTSAFNNGTVSGQTNTTVTSYAAASFTSYNGGGGTATMTWLATGY